MTSSEADRPDHLLTRTVRFCVPLSPEADPGTDRPRHNTFAAWPSMAGLGLYCELLVACRRAPHPVSGFVVDIGDVDDAVRRLALPIVAAAVAERDAVDPAALLARIATAVRGEIGHVERITWRLTPHYSLAVEVDRMKQVVMRQQFEFAAAHRLHSAALDDEANRRHYGKCNNPNGHGHNYRLEVAVAKALDSDLPSLQDVERIVHEHVVKRFDHTHLNLDTAEFSEVNPTVERIASVCFELAAAPVAALDPSGRTRLVEVTVWETDKTSCTYRGDAGA